MTPGNHLCRSALIIACLLAVSHSYCIHTELISGVLNLAPFFSITICLQSHHSKCAIRAVQSNNEAVGDV